MAPSPSHSHNRFQALRLLDLEFHGLKQPQVSDLMRHQGLYRVRVCADDHLVANLSLTSVRIASSRGPSPVPVSSLRPTDAPSGPMSRSRMYR